MIKFRRVLVLLIVVVSMLVVTASAEFSSSDSSNLDSIEWYVEYIEQYTEYIKDDVDAIRSAVVSIDLDIGNMYSYVQDIYSDVSNIDLYTQYIYARLQTTNDYIDMLNDYALSIKLNTDFMLEDTEAMDLTLDLILGSLFSGDKSVAEYAESTNGYLFDLHEVLASEEDKALKDETKDDTVAATDVMSKVDSASSVSSLGGFQSSFVDYFTIDTDVDSAEMFSFIDEGYSSWFTSTTAIGLYVGGGQAMTTGVMTADFDEPDTPLLDEKMDSVREQLGLE